MSIGKGSLRAVAGILGASLCLAGMFAASHLCGRDGNVLPGLFWVVGFWIGAVYLLMLGLGTRAWRVDMPPCSEESLRKRYMNSQFISARATSGSGRQDGARPFRRVGFAGLAVLICFTSSTASADLRIASFNTLHLGWGHTKNMAAMARVIEHFDLIGLQEVMHADAAKQLAHIATEQTGEQWDVITSHTVGRNGYDEGYAFIWRVSAVKYDGGAVLYLDPGDRFAREPFSAQFSDRSTGREFVAGTVHIIYGDSKADRTPEIRTLAAYWKWLGASFPNKPRLIMGDFNTEPSSPAWAPLRAYAQPAITQGKSTLSAHNGVYSHLYDNIWYGKSFKISGSGVARYPEWLGISNKLARKTVSDHAPVYIVTGHAHVDAATGARHSLVSTQAANRDKPNCVDINEAPASDLGRLDHVGPSRARKIIASRPFATLDELTKVRGLSASRVSDIRAQHITCMH